MKEKQNIFTKSHSIIIDILKEKGLTNYIGGIQLFTDQYSDDYSISIDYNSTGVHISKSQIDENELRDDDVIKICRTWIWKD